MLIKDLAINGLAPGVSITIPHLLSEDNHGRVPLQFFCTPAHALNVTAATKTTVTVRNDDPVETFTGILRCERIHTFQSPVALAPELGLVHPIGMSTTWKYNLSVGGLMNIGVAQINRLRMLGAPGKITQGNTVTIGADVYEFRDSTPPLGGTAGRIWIYNGGGGGTSAICRANFIDAVNGIVDAARITRTAQAPTAGTNVEPVKAMAGLFTGDIIVVSADAVGGNIVPTGTQQACSEVLTTAADVWDTGNMHSGHPQSTGRVAFAVAVISANDITKGSIQVAFPFTLAWANVSNMMRAQDEAWTLVGNNFVSLALASGASPHNQANDVIMVEAWGV